MKERPELKDSAQILELQDPAHCGTEGFDRQYSLIRYSGIKSVLHRQMCPCASCC